MRGRAAENGHGRAGSERKLVWFTDDAVLHSRTVRGQRLTRALILTVCLGAPLVEAFDRWDDTLRDGNDTEANLVIAALCVGFALSAVAAVVAWIRLLSSRSNSGVIRSTCAAVARMMPVPPIPTSSPPLALRI